VTRRPVRLDPDDLAPGDLFDHLAPPCEHSMFRDAVTDEPTVCRYCGMPQDLIEAEQETAPDDHDPED
jgi:hypothetical protein